MNNKSTCVIYAAIDTLSGYGARSRDTVKSIIELKKDEWDIKIIPCNWGNTPNGFIEDNPEWHFLNEYLYPQQLTTQPDVMIWITVPNEFQKVGKFNIGITAGLEINMVPVEWIEGMNRMDLTLVSSEHSKKAFLASKFQKVNDKTKQVEGIVEMKTPIEVIFEGVSLEVYQPIEWID
jgi:hypothetical protein